MFELKTCRSKILALHGYEDTLITLTLTIHLTHGILKHGRGWLVNMGSRSNVCVCE